MHIDDEPFENWNGFLAGFELSSVAQHRHASECHPCRRIAVVHGVCKHANNVIITFYTKIKR